MGLTLFQPEGEANCRGCVIAWKNQCKDIDGYNKTRVRVASAQAISPLSFSFSFFFTFMSLPASMELNRSSSRFAFLPGLIKYKLNPFQNLSDLLLGCAETSRLGGSCRKKEKNLINNHSKSRPKIQTQASPVAQGLRCPSMSPTVDLCCISLSLPCYFSLKCLQKIIQENKNPVGLSISSLKLNPKHWRTRLFTSFHLVSTQGIGLARALQIAQPPQTFTCKLLCPSSSSRLGPHPPWVRVLCFIFGPSSHKSQ